VDQLAVLGVVGRHDLVEVALQDGALELAHRQQGGAQRHLAAVELDGARDDVVDLAARRLGRQRAVGAEPLRMVHQQALDPGDALRVADLGLLQPGEQRAFLGPAGAAHAVHRRQSALELAQRRERLHRAREVLSDHRPFPSPLRPCQVTVRPSSDLGSPVCAG